MSIMVPEIGLTKEEQIDNCWEVFSPKPTLRRIVRETRGAWRQKRINELRERTETALQAAYEVYEDLWRLLDEDTAPLPNNAEADSWLALVWELADSCLEDEDLEELLAAANNPDADFVILHP